MHIISAEAWLNILLILVAAVICLGFLSKIGRYREERQLALELREVILSYFSKVASWIARNPVQEETLGEFMKLYNESFIFVNSALAPREKSWTELQREFNRILLELVRISKMAKFEITVVR